MDRLVFLELRIKNDTILSDFKIKKSTDRPIAEIRGDSKPIKLSG